ncbi:MAG TPA: hypothetical protein VGM43_15920 [Bryobacteraceae bacterium]|jgi:Arc/MetJ-type ribon-helix-helix transcriptional regulator
MGSRFATSVDLNPELERRIPDAVAAGRFQTAEELVETAVSWLLAFADACGGKLLTFDRALAPRDAQCLL